MSDAALQKAMDNAEASINMEGLHVSASCKKLCEKLMKNEITFEEYLSQILTSEDSDCSEKCS